MRVYSPGSCVIPVAIFFLQGTFNHLSSFMRENIKKENKQTSMRTKYHFVLH